MNLSATVILQFMGPKCYYDVFDAFYRDIKVDARVLFVAEYNALNNI